jgi:hypothetical protein
MQTIREVFTLVRQVIVFVLGVGVIIDAIVTSGTHVTELVVGLILIGVLPLESLLDRVARRREPQP